MIPQQRLSTTNLVGPLLYPAVASFDPLVSYHMGGVALNDPSQGLALQLWTLRVDVDDLVISAPSVPESVLFTAPGTTEVSLAFDQNMRPFVTFIQAGVSKYRWYDSSVGYQVTTVLNGQSPRCCLDDARLLEFGTSDIILGYMRAGSLYFRAQRDRYGVEYFLRTGVTEALLIIAMSTNNRLLFGVGTL